MKKSVVLYLSFLFVLQFSHAQNALTFNAAVASYVQVGNTMNAQLAGTNIITVEGWCFQTANVFLPTITGNYQSGSMQFLLRVDNNKPSFWVDNGTGFKNITGATTVPLNTWVHIAGVWDGSVMRIYYNGILDGTSTGITGSFAASINPVRIGANLTSEAWTGKLDAVRIWKAAKTAAQINAAMGSCLNGSEANLLALYNFEEGSGTTVADLTGHGYNGTFVSAPTWTTGHTCLVVLPVRFETVSADKKDNGIAVSWKVGTETNVHHYEVERSVNGRNFIALMQVPATGSSFYTWLDPAPLKNLSYYRVKSIDISGLEKYSVVVRTAGFTEQPAVTVWPTPVTGSEMQLQFTQLPKGKYELRLADAMGRIVFITTLQYGGGNSRQSIPLPASVNPGIYEMRITDIYSTAIIQKILIGK